QARSAIDGTHQNVSGILIGNGEIFSGGVETKMAWRFSAAGLFADTLKGSFFLVDLKYRDRIPSAIRYVDEFSVRMDGNFGPAVMAAEIVRQNGYSLHFGERSGFRIIGKGCNR